MRELIFIRHGQASFGRGDYDILSDRGREQAFMVAQYLLNNGVFFDLAYSGTLQRQVSTAEVVLDHLRANTATTLPLRKIEALNEYQFERIMSHYVPLVAQEDASLQPLVEELLTNKRSFQLVFDRVMTRWLGDESKLDRVEGWIRFKERIERGLHQITSAMEQDSRAIVFSSGGVISTAVHIATGMAPYEAIRIGWGLVNTSMTKFRFGSSGLILHSFNNYPHLEGYRAGELITYR